MPNYEEYCGFYIELFISESPTEWHLRTNIGTFIRNEFVINTEFQSLSRTFEKMEGAINCGIKMKCFAKQQIDDYLKQRLS